LLKVENSSTKGMGFTHQEELRKEHRGILVPCIDNFLVLIKPLFHPPQEGEWKQTKYNDLWCDTLYIDGVALLQAVLEMCIGVLARQPTEWICLDHPD
jgi:hypothetical protein